MQTKVCYILGVGKSIKRIARRIMQEKDLVIFPGALGDFICFFPTLRQLAKDRELDFLARTEYGDLLPPDVRTRSLECYEISRLFSPGPHKDQRLVNFFSSYATIWSWMGSNQPDFVEHLSVLAKGRLRIFPFRPVGSEVHLVDYYLSCLEGSYPGEISPIVPLRREAVAWSCDFWQGKRFAEKKVLALAPGSGAKEKNWPMDFYKILAGWWQREWSGGVVTVLGPVEEENRSLAYSCHPMSTVRGLSLAQLAALLSKCHLYLGNDSGVTHLAALLGVTTIAIFGPTDPIQWAPRGRRVTVVTRPVECSPCVPSVMKTCPHTKCLTALSPVDVMKVIEEICDNLKGPAWDSPS
jgi:ADP-heptose:LPS heptosyltransferase